MMPEPAALHGSPASGAPIAVVDEVAPVSSSQASASSVMASVT